MYRVLVLAAVSFAVVAADAEEDRRKCDRLTHPGSAHCCKNDLMPKKDMEDMKECFKNPPEMPPTCEHDICIASKRGFATTDGKIDKQALEKVIEKEFENYSELVEKIKEKCVNGVISKYGPTEMCDLTKMKHCIHLQMTTMCDEWNDNGPCRGIKELVQECEKIMA